MITLTVKNHKFLARRFACKKTVKRRWYDETRFTLRRNALERQTDRRVNGWTFFAMLLIVTSHLEFLSRTEMGEFYDRFLHNPTLGVDYFFLLSGFGMMISDLQKDKDSSAID